MNMNLGIVNRALMDVGQDALADQDIRDKNTAYRSCKQYYIDTFLEALSEVEWTGGRKRDRLAPTGRPILRDERFTFAYDLPFDCAKPIELQSNEFFTLEDRIIYTDTPEAELLYVSNGKILRPVAVISCGRPGGVPDMEYLTAGRPGDFSQFEVTVRAGRPADILDALPPDPEPADDFPDYQQLEYEPKFYEYIERALAAKFSMKLTNQPQLHLQMLQEAMLIKQEAVHATKIRRAARLEPKRWWTEEIMG
jgi:hypothetical protein